MADPLLDYMAKVNEDPTLMAKHNSDPEKAAKDFGLSDDDVQLITGGDQDKLRQRCALRDPGDGFIMTFHTPV